MTSTCFEKSGEGCCFRNVQLCSVYFVMAVHEVTTHTRSIFTVFLFEKGISFFFFILLRVSPGAHFAESVEEDRRV